MADSNEITFDLPQEAAPEPAVKAETTEVVEEAKEVTQTEQDKPADRTFTQAELDEIVQKRISKLERKLERQRIEQETRAKVTEELNQRQPEPASKPQPDQFEDYADYLEALADYKAEEKFNNLNKRQQEAQAQKSIADSEARQKERAAEMIQTGERKYDDFEDVVNNAKAEISQTAYLAILETENSADIVYHLCKNPEEADRIAKLPPYAQAKEIGKLEDKLSSKPVKLSNAPSPISPVKGVSAIAKNIEDMSVAEYEADARKRGSRWIR